MWKAKEKGSTPLGDRIKQERIRRGYDLTRFCEEVGVDQSQVTGYENRGAEPRLATLVAMAKVLDCSTDWLLGLEE